MSTTADSSLPNDQRPIIPPMRNYTIDLSDLDAEEEKKLNDVIARDIAFSQMADEQANCLRREMRWIRKAGLLRAWDKPQRRICARCKFVFWRVFLPFIDRGERCMNCKFKVCRKCRYQQTNGLFLCSLCLKQRQEKWVTGEWFHGGENNCLHGSDLLRVSLRNKRDSEYNNKNYNGLQHHIRGTKNRTVTSTVDLTHSDNKHTYKGSTMIYKEQKRATTVTIQVDSRFTECTRKYDDTGQVELDSVPSSKQSFELTLGPPSNEKHVIKDEIESSVNNDQTCQPKSQHSEVPVQSGITPSTNPCVHLGNSPACLHNQNGAIQHLTNAAYRRKHHTYNKHPKTGKIMFTSNARETSVKCANKSHRNSKKHLPNPHLKIGDSPTVHHKATDDVVTSNLSVESACSNVSLNLTYTLCEINKHSSSISKTRPHHRHDSGDNATSGDVVYLRKLDFDKRDNVNFSCENTYIRHRHSKTTENEHCFLATRGKIVGLKIKHIPGRYSKIPDTSATFTPDLCDLFRPAIVRDVIDVNFNFPPQDQHIEEDGTLEEEEGQRAEQDFEETRELVEDGLRQDLKEQQVIGAAPTLKEEEEQRAEKNFEETREKVEEGLRQDLKEQQVMGAADRFSRGNEWNMFMGHKSVNDWKNAQGLAARQREADHIKGFEDYDFESEERRLWLYKNKTNLYKEPDPPDPGPRQGVSSQTLTRRRRWWCLLCPFSTCWCEFGGCFEAY